MNYFDRYLREKFWSDPKFRTTSDIDTKMQLLGLTAIYIACKNEGCRCSLQLFVKLGSGKFNREEIKEMEMEIMFTLGWLLNPPLPQEFCEHFSLQLSKYTQSSHFLNIIQNTTTYLIEVSIQYNDFKFEKASALACAATLISLQAIKPSVMMTCQQEIRHSFLKQAEYFNFSTIENILSVENKISMILKTQFTNLGEFFEDFDPNGLIYSSSADPPILV